jgi:hypothetical protein
MIGSTTYLKSDRQWTYKRNIEARSRNHCCRGKATGITYSECVSVALGIPYAMRVLRVILSSLTCLAVPYFSTLSHKCHDFRINVTPHKLCVLIICATLSQAVLILRRIKRDIIGVLISP